MILAIDVGNTNIVVGCIDTTKKYFEARLSTDRSSTVEEYAVKIKSVLDLYSIDTQNIDGGIISNVVSELSGVLRNAVHMVIGKEPLIVGPGIKTGVNIKIDNPAELGSDLLVGAVAALNEYPLPQIIFDFGTATTASVINSKGEYIGGLIHAGVRISIDSLFQKTSQLPNIEICAPDKVIGTNSIDCMKSGSVYGAACMVDGIIRRIERELGEKAVVIATGGIAQCIIPYCESDIIYNDNLLLDGLLLIYNKNVKGA